MADATTPVVADEMTIEVEVEEGGMIIEAVEEAEAAAGEEDPTEKNDFATIGPWEVLVRMAITATFRTLCVVTRSFRLLDPCQTITTATTTTEITIITIIKTTWHPSRQLPCGTADRKELKYFPAVMMGSGDYGIRGLDLPRMRNKI